MPIGLYRMNSQNPGRREGGGDRREGSGQSLGCYPRRGQRNEVVVRGSPGSSLRQRKAHIGRRMDLSPFLVPQTAIPWPWLMDGGGENEKWKQMFDYFKCVLDIWLSIVYLDKAWSWYINIVNLVFIKLNNFPSWFWRIPYNNVSLMKEVKSGETYPH